MRTPTAAAATSSLTAALLLGFATLAQSAARDPAARGMDLFIHAPAEGVSGGRLPVQVQVFGFATVSTLAPLGQARVEAVWEAASLGPGAPPPPAAVTVTADDAGCAHLDVPIPRGAKETALKLLLSASWHDHQRTRELDVKRLSAHEIDLRVSDNAVVPGGALSSWVFVRDAASRTAVADATVDLELKEGGATRFTRRLTTDRSGMAATQVPVPFTDDPDWRWALTATTAFKDGDNAQATVDLRVREEIPALPTVEVRWADPAVRPGSRTAFLVSARDGAQVPLPNLPLRTWVGARGTEPPRDDVEWQQVSTALITDGEGKASVPIDTPRTISPRGAGMTVVVRATVEGRPLSATDTLALEEARPALEVIPEFGALLPGQTQRLFVHLTYGKDPVSTDLAIDGHALAARVHTDARGWGETTWAVPRDVGARVPGGRAGCAEEVAATVRVRPLGPAPGGAAVAIRPTELCVGVDRDARGAIQPVRPVVRAGDALPVRVVGGPAPRRQEAALSSVILHARDSAGWAAGWLAGARTNASGRGDDRAITVPASASGVWSISATIPGVGATADESDAPAMRSGNVLVLPRVLPSLTARVVGGDRAVRGAHVEVEATLNDGHNQPLTGSVGAVVIDKRGGAHPENLLALDTRRALAAALEIPQDEFDAFVAGDGERDARPQPQHWAALARAERGTAPPAVDPIASLRPNIDEAFGHIVLSLEGGVFEASGDPERLRDVRIRTPRGSALNPEMLTLTTEAMETPPTTPGGEPWRLSDLMSIDPQVRYDVVARRVTRLKLFRVLVALRKYLYENHLGLDEPALREPNALLRRLVHSQALDAADLLDPWGQGLAFVRASGPRVPFLSMVPGYRLQSAGPDGRHGTADDVRDPFQRVLRSNTPYARAVDEDRLVDARWDMRVGDDTVEAWTKTLNELTGSELGDQEADGEGGLGAIGTGGGGYGRGAGGLGGRRSRGVEVGPAAWLPPVRTDDQGRVRLKIPLGATETTWQILLVGVPDGGSPAVTSLEVPLAASLSLTVATGASWIAGDQVGVAVTLRNRTDRALAGTLRVAAAGAAALADPRVVSRVIELPPRSTTVRTVFVRALRPGQATLDASIATGGKGSDAVRHEWDVKPAAEPTTLIQAARLDGETTLPLPVATADDAQVAAGPARLVLERGLGATLAAALESLRPERLVGLRAIADALEIFVRVRTWAVSQGGDRDKLAVRASDLAALTAVRGRGLIDRDNGRASRREGDDSERAWRMRASLWEAAAVPAGVKRDAPRGRRDSDGDCPPRSVASLTAKLDWLEVTPPARQGTDRSCWVAFQSSALQQLAAANDPLLLARTFLAVVERAPSGIVVAALADRLRAAAPLRADATLTLPSVLATDRSARAIIMAAHLRARSVGRNDAAVAIGTARLAARLIAERDAEGGYGSAQATRAVVRALLEAESGPPRDVQGPVEVRWNAQQADGRTGPVGRAVIGRSGTTIIPLAPTATGVRLVASGPGVVARVERPMLRPFARASEPVVSPLVLQLEAPTAARAQTTATLHVSVRHTLGRSAPVVVRIPLPPGTNLADPVEGVRQVQGALYVRTHLDSDPLPRVLAIPVRFSLPGTVTWPGATARIDDEEFPAARAPARPLVIGAPPR